MNIEKMKKNADRFLFMAVMSNNVKWVKKLLETGANVNSRFTILGATPLMHAKNAEICKLLIEAGANVNAVDKNGNTALMHAKNAETCKLLIEAGANVNAVDKNGNTALMWLIKDFSNRKNNSDFDYSRFVQQLMVFGANKVDVNVKNNQNKTVFDFVDSVNDRGVYMRLMRYKMRGRLQQSSKETVETSRMNKQ